MWEVGMCFPGVTAGAHLEGDQQHHPDSWSGQPRASEGPTVATFQLPPISLLVSASQGICGPAACLRAHAGLSGVTPPPHDAPL